MKVPAKLLKKTFPCSLERSKWGHWPYKIICVSQESPSDSESKGNVGTSSADIQLTRAGARARASSEPVPVTVGVVYVREVEACRCSSERIMHGTPKPLGIGMADTASFVVPNEWAPMWDSLHSTGKATYCFWGILKSAEHRLFTQPCCLVA